MPIVVNLFAISGLFLVAAGFLFLLGSVLWWSFGGILDIIEGIRKKEPLPIGVGIFKLLLVLVCSLVFLFIAAFFFAMTL